jgi:4-hydroxyphenylpyruvate dioxygenase-like putative hemolysin
VDLALFPWGPKASRVRRDVSRWISNNERQEAVMFKRIDHVEIVTDQLDRTEQFYTDVLH